MRRKRGNEKKTWEREENAGTRREYGTVGSAIALHVIGHEFKSHYFQKRKDKKRKDKKRKDKKRKDKKRKESE